MKKLTLLAIVAILSVSAVNAGAPRSIGIRVGNNWDITYQNYLDSATFITAEIGIPGYTFPATGPLLVTGIYGAVIYDMLDPYGAKFKPVKKGSWHWYMGIGLKGGTYNRSAWDFSNPYWHVGVATHIGIEYDCSFPMIIFFDSRATFGVTNWSTDPESKVVFDGTAPLDLAIGLRYKF